MSGVKRFLLDANIFIQAYRTYYSFSVCPGFWDALVRQHEAKRVISIDKVKDELVEISDELSVWATETVPDSFFKGTTDRRVIDAYREIANWVQNEQQFTPEAKAEFLRGADGWVIAYAIVNGFIVVTHEDYAPDARRTVPMPNVCLEFHVEYCNTFEMLLELKEQFVLRHRKAKD